MNLFDKLKGSNNRYSMGVQNEGVFTTDKNYTLVEVITLFKYQAYANWAPNEPSNEALEILLIIASIRECLLNDAKLKNVTDEKARLKETRNVDVKLGKVLRDFELLCERYTLPNPLANLEGSDALQEMKKLIALDEDFYGNENAFVITEEIYNKKRKDLGADFFLHDEICSMANIQLYDTMILLMLEVIDYDSKVISTQIKEQMFKLRKLVADRKAIDVKAKNVKSYSIEDIDAIDNISLLMGEIKAFFDGIADEFNIPNRLCYAIEAKEFWQKLSSMFEVLNSVPVVIDNKKKDNVKKIDIKSSKADDSTKASDK